jgi:hypothetical protein
VANLGQSPQEIELKLRAGAEGAFVAQRVEEKAFHLCGQRVPPSRTLRWIDSPRRGDAKKIAKGANVRRQSWRSIQLNALRSRRGDRSTWQNRISLVNALHRARLSFFLNLRHPRNPRFRFPEKFSKNCKKVLTFPREPN